MKLLLKLILVALATFSVLVCLRVLGQMIHPGTTHYWVGRSGAAGETAPPNITNGFLEGWRLDEVSGVRTAIVSALDNLTDVNTVTSDTGVVTNAAKFTHATAERLYLGSADPSSSSTAFSTFGWIKTFTTPTIDCYIMHSYHNINGDSLALYLNPATTNIVGFVHTGGAPGTYNYVTNSTIITNNGWYFIYYAYDSDADRLVLTVNNANSATNASATVNKTSSVLFVLGANNNDPNNTAWNGLLDEWYFYSRELTIAEQTWLYAGRTFPFQ